MPTTDDDECKWMLPMNESRSKVYREEREKEMILVASMPAAFIRVIERLKPKKREREKLRKDDFDEQLW